VFWIGGMLDCFVVEGSINADMFYLAVATTLLSHIQTFPKERTVVIADNCNTHHFDRWILDLQHKGGIAHFLQVLSPTLNPIEDAFKLTRMWSRENCHRLAEFTDEVAFIRAALMSVNTQGARHCIHNCSTFNGVPAYSQLLDLYTD
jgi:hypothetical protein